MQTAFFSLDPKEHLVCGHNLGFYYINDLMYCRPRGLSFQDGLPFPTQTAESNFHPGTGVLSHCTQLLLLWHLAGDWPELPINGSEGVSNDGRGSDSGCCPSSATSWPLILGKLFNLSLCLGFLTCGMEKIVILICHCQNQMTRSL